MIGEPHSFASRKRRNKYRTIVPLESMSRMAHGRDLVFRVHSVGHSVPYVFGARKAGSKNEDNTGIKFINKTFYKLSFVLKDMLDCVWWLPTGVAA